MAAVDVLVPRLGEIIGGSQREERLDVLTRRIRESGLDDKDYWWYLDTRRYGTVPHSGFGLGFERTVQFVTSMANIRDVIPFPRSPATPSSKTITDGKKSPRFIPPRADGRLAMVAKA